MERRLFVVLVMLTGLGGCKKDVPNGLICGKADPVNELPWLKQKIDSIRTDRPYFPLQVNAYQYQRSTVFHIESGLFSTLYYHLYQCNGARGLGSKPDYGDYSRNRQLVKVLYEQK